MDNKKLAPSILSADFTNLAMQIRSIELGGADWVHCDIMDGQFVPNLTFGPIVVAAVKRITNLPIDVHLMIKNPDNLIEEFVNSGANYITVHQEEVVHLNRTIQKIHDLGAKAGIAINPATPVGHLTEVLELADLLLVMSVNPGFGGQKFIESSLRKISELNNLRIKNSYNYLIEVDGGVSKENIKTISDAGCDVFVAGNSVFKSPNITASAIELKNLLNGR